MTRQLSPLPECVLASISLRKLGVDTDTPIGWAPACLALTTTVHAVRPGAQLHLRLRGDFVRVTEEGGIAIAGDDALDSQMTAWVTTNRTTSLTCGNCGRPGLKRPGFPLAICDACRYLAGHTEATKLPFIPPLPLPDETLAAIDAVGKIERPERFHQLPTGWTRLVHSTIRELPTPELAATVTFKVHDDTVSLAFEDEASSPEQFTRLNERLEVNARVHCRRCSRRLTTESSDPPHDSVCPGCRWVESRGWEVVRTDDIGRHLPGRDAPEGFR